MAVDAGVVIGLISIVLASIAIVIGHPIRLSHKPVEPTRLPRIRRWRSKNFRFGLYLIDEYAKAVAEFPSSHGHRASSGSGKGGNAPRRNHDLEDLRRWSYQVVLSCACSIVADSQSRARLFRVISKSQSGSDGTTIQLGCLEVAGNFLLGQMVDGPSFRLTSGNRTNGPNEVRLVYSDAVRLDPLRKDSLKKDERALGTTHVLGIPILESVALAERGTVASLAVDLRLGWFRRSLYSSEFVFHRSQLLRRAEALQASTQDLVKALRSVGIGE